MPYPIPVWIRLRYLDISEATKEVGFALHFTINCPTSRLNNENTTTYCAHDFRDAGGNELWLPNDTNTDGFDPYVVTDVQLLDGAYWVSIYLGSQDFGWVPLDAVTPMTYIPGVEK